MPFNPANLHSAFIITCENVLREESGVTSLIRIIDLHELSGPIPKEGVTIRINAWTIIKSRTQTKDHAFSMEIVFPDGVNRAVQATDDGRPLLIAFGSKSPETNPIFGAQVLIQINLTATIAGLYTLRAMIDGHKVAETAITLRAPRSS